MTLLIILIFDSTEFWLKTFLTLYIFYNTDDVQRKRTGFAQDSLPTTPPQTEKAPANKESPILKPVVLGKNYLRKDLPALPRKTLNGFERSPNKAGDLVLVVRLETGELCLSKILSSVDTNGKRFRVTHYVNMCMDYTTSSGKLFSILTLYNDFLLVCFSKLLS